MLLETNLIILLTLLNTEIVDVIPDLDMVEQAFRMELGTIQIFLVYAHKLYSLITFNNLTILFILIFKLTDSELYLDFVVIINLFEVSVDKHLLVLE